MPCCQPLLDLIVGELHTELTPEDVENHDIAFADSGDRAATSCFWRNMTGHQSVGGSGKTAVGEQRHGAAQTGPDQRRRDREHLAHTRSATRTFVADHQHIASLDSTLLHSGKRFLFAVENARWPAVMKKLVAREFDDTSFGGEIAFQDDEAAARLDGRAQWTHYFLTRRLGCGLGFFADAFAADRERIPVKQTRLIKTFGYQSGAASAIQIRHHESPSGLEIGQQWHP